MTKLKLNKSRKIRKLRNSKHFRNRLKGRSRRYKSKKNKHFRKMKYSKQFRKYSRGRSRRYKKNLYGGSDEKSSEAAKSKEVIPTWTTVGDNNNTLVDGNALRKIRDRDHNCSDWDIGAYSNEEIKFMPNVQQGVKWSTELSPQGGVYEIGLSYTPGPIKVKGWGNNEREGLGGKSDSMKAFAIFCEYNGATIWEDGEMRHDLGEYESDGDTYEIRVCGDTVEYFVNNKHKYTSTKQRTEFPLKVDCSFWNCGARANNVRLILAE